MVLKPLSGCDATHCSMYKFFLLLPLAPEAALVFHPLPPGEVVGGDALVLLPLPPGEVVGGAALVQHHPNLHLINSVSSNKSPMASSSSVNKRVHLKECMIVPVISWIITFLIWLQLVKLPPLRIPRSSPAAASKRDRDARTS
ncbi:hypothetical protein BRADI_1g56685v3 [Brachypodium distachyon]|uniref:Uncharacterized protein n=1 Tax=Brachypodium distachyon TaxID=15368 RepID=A0A0Q3HE14_BRADI|nr:hypothetical protein BRADI_1g56685v3 [Brachypodium distachyon]